MTHVMVVRLDNAGDVLLAGPAVRAVAAGADQVTLWCGPRGRAAADLLPGVDRVVEHRAEWIDPTATTVDRDRVLGFVDELTALRIDRALVLTSYHQSPLPAALLLRLAGVTTIAAVSEDFPGALLDVRHRVDRDVHEVERSLSLAAALGYRLPAADHGGLEVALPNDVQVPAVGRRVIAVHPGASVPARAWSPTAYRELVDALSAAGWRVVVTGGPDERELTAFVAGTTAQGEGERQRAGGRGSQGEGERQRAGGRGSQGEGERQRAGGRGYQGVVDLGGCTNLAQLAAVLARCEAVVTGNTGPAHLAAAVGTPVVSLFAPTVPASRWRPWGVRHELLGRQDIACAGCRATHCPLPGHPCVGEVTAADVLAAVRRLLADKDATMPPLVRERHRTEVLA
jgi:ADP-heptose:LPS heptosyltransferase